MILGKTFGQRCEDMVAAVDLLKSQPDSQFEKEVERDLAALHKAIGLEELKHLFKLSYDINNAIVTIHPGAGGTESKDWAQMLVRLYTRFCESRGWKTEMVDLQPGEEAGVKNAVFTVQGDYAYGFLHGEQGVHRLVRISPFDANKRRHTSFASVEVMPELDETIKVDIRDEDLRLDTFRASGAGGQHVNKTSSAIRIVHIPTNIVVQCQNERSQSQNKATAMKMLKAKLFIKGQEEMDAKLKKIAGDKMEISFGSQIRSYVFQPYTMVKDHRTELEIGNVQAVMDGEIDPFIEAYLKR